MPRSLFIPNWVSIPSTMRSYSTANLLPCRRAQNQKKKSEEIKEAEAGEISDFSRIWCKFPHRELDKEHPRWKRGSTISLCCKSLNKSLLTPVGSLKPSSVLPRATSSQVWAIQKAVSNHKHLHHQHLTKTVVRGPNWWRHFSSRSKMSSSSAGQLDIMKLDLVGSPQMNLAASVPTPHSSPRACVQSRGGRMLDLRETLLLSLVQREPLHGETTSMDCFCFCFLKGRLAEGEHRWQTSQLSTATRRWLLV